MTVRESSSAESGQLLNDSDALGYKCLIIMKATNAYASLKREYSAKQHEIT